MNRDRLIIYGIAIPVALIFVIPTIVFAYNSIQIDANDKSVEGSDVVSGPLPVEESKEGDSQISEESSTDTNSNANAPVDQASGTNASNSAQKSTSSGITKWDDEGCQIGSASYQVCRQNVFNAKCSADDQVAYKAYHAAYNPVRASYDADSASFQKELDDLVARGVYTRGQTYSIWNDFVHKRTQTFNAAVTPIYNNYVASVDALNAGGCKIYKYAISNPTLPF